MKRALTYVALLLVASLMAAPFVWLLLTSLKGGEDVFAFPPTFIPDELRFENYAETWRAVPFGAYIVNSILVSFGTVISNVLLASLAAYPLARMEFRGKTLFFILILSTMMVPEQVIMIPLYQLTLQLGLLNTLVGVVLPFSVNAFGIFLMRQFYLAIPRELEDAAVMDGCSPLRIWWSILVPADEAGHRDADGVHVRRVVELVPVAARDPPGEREVHPPGRAELPDGDVLGELPVRRGGRGDRDHPGAAVYVSMQKYFIEGILSGGVKGCFKNLGGLNRSSLRPKGG
jgi:putative chitobiose transport system permease protein